jgi:putative Holliday junction resolvase
MNDQFPGRILAVDPGEVRLGLAISDPTQTIASPLQVIKHHSLAENAQRILEIANNEEAVLIVIGQPLHWDGKPSPQAKKSIQLADEIRKIGSISVILWDEFGSTQQAQKSRQKMGGPREKSSGHLDEIAATIILQDYLENNPGKNP